MINVEQDISEQFQSTLSTPVNEFDDEFINWDDVPDVNQQLQSTPSTTVNDIDDDSIDWDAMCPICGDEVEDENEGGEVQCDGCDQ